MKVLQKELDELHEQGYYFMCTNNAYSFEDEIDYAPNGEFVVVIEKVGKTVLTPTAVHENLYTAIEDAIRVIKVEIAERAKEESS